MASTISRIPSVSIPFTDSQGRISPIWHEFLRSFISSVVEDEEGEESNLSQNIVAGAGLRKLTNGSTVTLSVGAGQGITVNADDVNVDVFAQQAISPVLDDEILISDISDNNNIRKTTLRAINSIAGAANPGGGAGAVQYNNAGTFGGDTGMSTDGSGNVNIVGSLDVDNISVNGNTIAVTNTNGDMSLTANGTGSLNAMSHIELDSNIFIYGVGGSPVNGPRIEASASSVALSQTASAPQVDFAGGAGNNGSFLMRLKNAGTVRFASDNSGIFIQEGGGGEMPLRRTVDAGQVASTTQAQGQSPVTADIVEVSTVANNNDVITLPEAMQGRSCIVINNGLNTLQVFPALGDDLGAGVNASTTIVASSRKWFVSYDTVNWEPVL